MKKIIVVTLMVLLAGALVLVGCAQPAPAPSPSPTAPAPSSTAPAPSPTATTPPKPTAQPVTLKAVMCWPESNPGNGKFLDWVKAANAAGKGQFQINVVGGPEAIPFNEQLSATRKDVVDIVHIAGGYYTGDIPEVFALLLSQLTPTEERQNGLYDLMNKIMQEKGLYYMGRTQGVCPLGYVVVNIEAKKPSDLKGLKIRSAPVYDPLLKEVGAVPVNLQLSEVYNAMQQRVVDGFVWNFTSGFVDIGLNEVSKYIIDEPFYQTPTTVLFNLDAWNKLSPDSQKILTSTFIDMEKTVADFWVGISNAEIKKATDKGVKLVKFSPEDSKWWRDTAYRLGWEATLPKTPQYGEQLRKLSSK